MNVRRDLLAPLLKRLPEDGSAAGYRHRIGSICVQLLNAAGFADLSGIVATYLLASPAERKQLAQAAAEICRANGVMR